MAAAKTARSGRLPNAGGEKPMELIHPISIGAMRSSLRRKKSNEKGIIWNLPKLQEVHEGIVRRSQTEQADAGPRRVLCRIQKGDETMNVNDALREGESIELDRHLDEYDNPEMMDEMNVDGRIDFAEQKDMIMKGLAT